MFASITIAVVYTLQIYILELKYFHLKNFMVKTKGVIMKCGQNWGLCGVNRKVT